MEHLSEAAARSGHAGVAASLRERAARAAVSEYLAPTIRKTARRHATVTPETAAALAAVVQKALAPAAPVVTDTCTERVQRTSTPTIAHVVKNARSRAAGGHVHKSGLSPFQSALHHLRTQGTTR